MLGRLRVVAVAMFLASGLLIAADPAFEVATIKPTDPGFTGRGIQMPPNDNRFSARGQTLKDLIQFAYAPGAGSLHPAQVAGGPNWSTQDRYDVVAKAEGDAARPSEELKLMLRPLLADRFKLTFHH
jgi:uncharacterized protein (TIGR03435 family)